MRLTAKTVHKWLTENGPATDMQELLILEKALNAAKVAAQARQAEHAKTLEMMNEVAKHAGFANLEEFMAIAGGGIDFNDVRFQMRDANASRSDTRKPFMDPLDPHSDCWAFAHRPELPAWAQARLAEGWERQELHYKRHAEGFKRLGLKQKYDAVKRMAELQANTPTFKRTRK